MRQLRGTAFEYMSVVQHAVEHGSDDRTVSQQLALGGRHRQLAHAQIIDDEQGPGFPGILPSTG